MDVRRLPMAHYLGVPPFPQPVIEIGLVHGVGVRRLDRRAPRRRRRARARGGVLRRAADALLATDVSWFRGRPWRGSHATMTPTQLANQLLDQGFRNQHLRFMAGLGDLQWQQQHVLIIPPHNYFAAPAGESPFYRRRRACVRGAPCSMHRDVFDARRHPRRERPRTPPRPRSPGDHADGDARPRRRRAAHGRRVRLRLPDDASPATRRTRRRGRGRAPPATPAAASRPSTLPQSRRTSYASTPRLMSPRASGPPRFFRASRGRPRSRSGGTTPPARVDGRRYLSKGRARPQTPSPPFSLASHVTYWTTASRLVSRPFDSDYVEHV